MADQKIPYEYQTDYGQIGELQAIAEAMERQRLLNRQSGSPQMVSGHYIRRSPMQGLADMFAAYQGGQARYKAGKLRGELSSKMAADESGQIGKIAQLMTGSLEPMGPPTAEGEMGLGGNMPNPARAAQTALTSQFPRVRDLGKELGARSSATFSTAFKDSTPASQAVALQQGGNPMALAPEGPERFGEPSVIPGLPQVPGRPPVMGQQNTRTGRWSELGGSGTTTNIDLGNRTDSQAILQERDYLYGKDGSALAKTTRGNLATLGSAMSAVATTPINTGVDSTVRTFAQSLSQITGATVPENVPATQLYRAFVVPQVGNVIKQFGAGTGLSDADREFASKAVAMAENDPRMIQVALAYMLRAELTEAHAYNDRVAALRDSAVEKGLDPRLYDRPINFKVDFTDFQKAFGLPDDILKAGALEAWTARVMRPKSAELDDAVRRNLGQPREGMGF